MVDLNLKNSKSGALKMIKQNKDGLIPGSLVTAKQIAEVARNKRQAKKVPAKTKAAKPQ